MVDVDLHDNDEWFWFTITCLYMYIQTINNKLLKINKF